ASWNPFVVRVVVDARREAALEAFVSPGEVERRVALRLGTLDQDLQEDFPRTLSRELGVESGLVPDEIAARAQAEMKSGQLLAGANFGEHELALATESVGQGLIEFPTGVAQEKARKGGAGPPRHVLPVKLREQGADRLGRRVMTRADGADLRKRFLVP